MKMRDAGTSRSIYFVSPRLIMTAEDDSLQRADRPWPVA
jgi:hypothetical protein